MREDFEKFLSKIGIVLVTLTVALSVNYIYAAWTGPSANPPGSNAPAPINVGGDQVKSGGLWAGSFASTGGIAAGSSITAGTTVWSPQYCFAGGASCISSWPSGGGTPGGSDGQVQYNDGGLFGGSPDIIYNDVTDLIGIGAISPNYDLHVNDPDQNGSAYLQLTNPTTGTLSSDGLLVGVDTLNESRIHNRENSALKFFTNNTEVARFTGAGRLGVGVGTAPAESIHASGRVRGNTGLCIGTDCRSSWPGGGGWKTTRSVVSATGSSGNPPSATRNCLANEIAIGGGCRVQPTNCVHTIQESYPNDTNGWYCRANYDGSSGGAVTGDCTVTAYVVCLQ